MSAFGPEVLSLAKAIGLIGPSGGFEAQWFQDPLNRLQEVLDDDAQREALLELLDHVLVLGERQLGDAHDRVAGGALPRRDRVA